MTTFPTGPSSRPNDGSDHQRERRGNLPISVVLPLCAAAITVLGTVAVPVPAQADGGCIPGDATGQVPRNARPGDNVCVPPNIADLVQQENATAQAGYVPGGGAYGPLTCKQGLVWREAFDGDGVCVSPARRQQTWDENAAAGVGATGPGGGSTGSSGTNVNASELLGLVNDARTHPEKYPPNGDAAGASMTACGNALQNSSALAGAAQTHNNYLTTQPTAVVNDDTNMHKNPPPNGPLSWDDGGPIAKAGYNSYRAEIVAIGQGSAAAAMQFWMQNDAPWQWGHRNLILNCTIGQAGAAHLQGGPGGNYWTVDMGNP
jgi:hypothetical protein